MSAQNRLADEQLAALSPGDEVAIETCGDFGRPRHWIGTVLRLAHRRVGSKQGGGALRPPLRPPGRRLHRRRAPLRARRPHRRLWPVEQRGNSVHIDALYLAWKRSRDEEALRQLHEAIGERLAIKV